jgi:hypothetical protein
MYKLKTLICIWVVILISSNASFASHLQGGEITWRVDSNQNIIFRLVLYRDCNGVPGPTSAIIQSNSPLSTIQCSLINSVDLSPTGPGCPSCAAPQAIFSAIQELIYESAPLNFGSSVPPNSGWYFYYADCCRYNSITNLSGSGGSNFILRSVMYPFNGMAATLVQDNSPTFFSSPQFAFPLSKYIYFSNAANDPDLDSLSYSWAEPLDGTSYPGTPYPFNVGYSFSSPFPGTNLNPNNIPATMNSNTGIVNFKSYNSGLFTTVTKVTSYKCGVKTAEIFREIQMSILNTSSNNAPIFGGSAVVDTTILAGDTLRMNFSVTDFDTLTGGGFQSVNLSASSLHLGSSFTQGCLIQPCGVLNIPTPYNFSLFSQVSLTFPTNCSHAGFSNGCLQHQRLFTFEFNAHDNFCPVNGVSNKIINVYVTGPEIQLVGNDLVVNYPGASFQWCLNGVPIPGATGTSFTPTQNGIYTLLTSTTGGCTMISNAVNRTASGLSGQQADRMFNVYPNPMSQGGQLNILVNGLGTGDALINILDVSGRLVKQIPVQLSSNTEHLIVDASDLSKGVYSIQLTTSSTSQKANVVIQ